MKQSVIGIVFNANRDQVLILERRDVSIWVFPGGGVDKNETSEQAVVREIAEETGLETQIVRKVAEYAPLNRLANLTHVYECQKIGGKLALGPETKEVCFVSLDQLPLNFFHLHLEWLQDAEKKFPHVIKRANTTITYGKLFVYFFRHPIRVIRILLSRIGYPING